MKQSFLPAKNKDEENYKVNYPRKDLYFVGSFSNDNTRLLQVEQD